MIGNIGRASRLAATIAVAALIAGSPAVAAPDPDTAATSSASKAQDEKPVSKTRMICVRSVITGSRIPQQTCKTRERWIKEDGVDPLEMQAR